MAKLIFKSPAGTKTFEETPFNYEEQLETLIFDTPSVFDGVYLVNKEAGSMGQRPDILGVDTNGNMCVIEIKNVQVTSHIRNQILKYAQRAEDNYTELKNHCEATLKNVDINRKNHDKVRVFIIAPSFDTGITHAIVPINRIYPVELIEVKRRINDGEGQIFLVNKIDQHENFPANGGLHTINPIDETPKDPESLKALDQYIQDTKKLIEEKKWNLEIIQRVGGYYVFKSGFFNVFTINRISSKSFAFCFKMTKNRAEGILKDMHIPMTKYDGKHAIFEIKPGETNVNDLIPMMEYCYKKICK